MELSASLPVKKHRLLVVDDDEAILKFLKRLLEQAGYNVAVAATAEQALQQFQNQPADLVLLDIHMSGMNGLDLLLRLKQIIPQLPVLMVTGNQDEDLARTAIKMGAFDYVTKPISKEYLLLVLETKLF